MFTATLRAAHAALVLAILPMPGSEPPGDGGPSARGEKSPPVVFLEIGDLVRIEGTRYTVERGKAGAPVLEPVEGGAAVRGSEDETPLVQLQRTTRWGRPACVPR